MTTWTAVLAVGLGSYLFRVLPQLLPRFGHPSPGVERAIRHGGLAALTALAVTSLRHHVEAGDGRLLPALAAVTVGFALVRAGRSLTTVVVAGTAVWAALLALTG